jgi:flagellin
MLSGMNIYALRIADFYNANNVDLGKTMFRLASGKKTFSPSDNSADYMRAQSFNATYRNYSHVVDTLSEWGSAMETASSAAGTVLDNLNRMKELVYLADQKISDPVANSAELNSYQTEFAELASANKSIVQSTNWNGTSLLNNPNQITAIYLVPGSVDYSLVIHPDEAVNVAADIDPLLTDTGNHSLNVDAAKLQAAEDHVDAAMGQLRPFITTIGGYQSNIQSQQKVDASIMQNVKSASSVLTDIGEADEMITYTSQSIRKQTSLAMLAQANVSSQSILLLYGLKGQ